LDSRRSFHEKLEPPQHNGVAMKLAIVAYPSLAEIDRRWIESLRATHDPQASRLGVHFTLVFPVEAALSDLSSEVADVARTTPPISFTIRGAEVVRDALSNDSHIFLVPDEGQTQIAALHDRLYQGALRAHLRTDIPFIPHMTVAAASDPQLAKRLAGEIGARARLVRGTIADLAVVDVGAPRVRSVATYALGQASR
jgi:2'-5' RNA ligase